MDSLLKCSFQITNNKKKHFYTIMIEYPFFCFFFGGGGCLFFCFAFFKFLQMSTKSLSYTRNHFVNHRQKVMKLYVLPFSWKDHCTSGYNLLSSHIYCVHRNLELQGQRSTDSKYMTHGIWDHAIAQQKPKSFRNHTDLSKSINRLLRYWVYNVVLSDMNTKPKISITESDK